MNFHRKQKLLFADLLAGKQKLLFSAFSVYSNGKKLFESNNSASKDIIECVHGIRALSILWIVHGHRVQTYATFPIINKVQFREVLIDVKAPEAIEFNQFHFSNG